MKFGHIAEGHDATGWMGLGNLRAIEYTRKLAKLC